MLVETRGRSDERYLAWVTRALRASALDLIRQRLETPWPVPLIDLRLWPVLHAQSGADALAICLAAGVNQIASPTPSLWRAFEATSVAPRRIRMILAQIGQQTLSGFGMSI